MADFTFAVFRETGQGANTGRSDAFLNIQKDKSLDFKMYDRGNEIWRFKAVKFYWVEAATIHDQKRADMAGMNGGQTAKFKSVFGEPPTPGSTVTDASGASYVISTDTTTATLSNSGTSGQALEFLLWIQDANGKNDWVDPGIRNDF